MYILTNNNNNNSNTLTERSPAIRGREVLATPNSELPLGYVMVISYTSKVDPIYSPLLFPLKVQRS